MTEDAISSGDTDAKAAPTILAKKRAIVYIDGFNFYNGAIKGTLHKWLDLQKYFERLRQADDVSLIRYFTAKMVGPSGDRQMVYLQALDTLPKLDVVLGRYKQKQLKCKVAACLHPGRRVFDTFEEKRTDVNIALAMLDDAYQGLCDIQVVVSGDSDLVPAMNFVKMRFPEIAIHVYVPARDPMRGAAIELRAASDRDKTLPLDLLGKCHFPPQVPDGSGGLILKPATW